MSLTIEPKQGIRLNLGSYSKIRSYQGGGEFWEHQNQQVVMQYLGEFLPRAVENEGGKAETVLFTHLINGKDVLSQSTALGAGGQQAPAEQLNRLRDAITRLKAKESDPLIDPNARKLIEAFRLPDPQKDPELYRIASGSTRRLLVLWGVEKERNSSLAPSAAVARVPAAAGMPSWLKWLLLLLLILLLLGLAWWLWMRPQDRGTVSIISREGSTVVLTEPSTEPRADSPPPASTPGTSAFPARTGTPSSDPLFPLTNSQQGSPGSTNQTTSPGVAPGPGNPSGVNFLSARSGGPIPKAATTPADATSTAPSAIPGSSLKPAPTDIDRIRNTEGQTLPPSAARPGEPPGSQSNTPAKQPSGSAPMPETTDGTPPAPAKPTQPFSPAGDLPDDMKLEITNSRTSAEPRNGKVEVVLTAVGRDSKGEPIAITAVKRWTIDGVPQKDAAGAFTTSTALPISLTKGTHKCLVEGTDRSGRPVTAAADVEVGIQVTEKTDVKVRPRK